MFLFALKMYVADMKRILRSFWWIVPFFLILIVIAPFCGTEMYALVYVIMMECFIMIPRYSRIHFVVPLDEKQLKKFFLWRILIVCGLIVVIASVFVGISLWQNWALDPEGYVWVADYLIVYLLTSETGLQGLGIKPKKFEVRHIFLISLAIIGLFAGMVLVHYLSIEWSIICLVVIPVLMATTYMFWYLRKIKMEDYTYVPIGYWENGKTERE